MCSESRLLGKFGEPTRVVLATIDPSAWGRRIGSIALRANRGWWAILSWWRATGEATVIHVCLLDHSTSHASTVLLMATALIYNIDRHLSIGFVWVFSALTQLRHRYTIAAWPSSAQKFGCLCLSSCLYMPSIYHQLAPILC